MSVSTVFEIAGHRLSVLVGNDQGPGPTVLFLPGILGSERFWPPLVSRMLHERARWYAVSLPGHFPARFPVQVRSEDLSPERLTDLLSELIRRLVGTTPVHLVGWSTGGCLALQLAANDPHQVRSVLSVAGFGRGRWHGVLGVLQKLARGGRFARLLFRRASRLIVKGKRWYQWAYSRTAADPRTVRTSELACQVLHDLREDARRQDVEAMRLLIATIRDWDVMEQLRSIRVPVLIAGGDQDPIIPYRHTCELARIIPDARLVTFRGVGHAFFAEALPAFQACLHSWLEEVVRPERRPFA